MSVTVLRKTTIAELAQETQGDGRLYDARTWADLLAAYGLDAEDVERSAAVYFRELVAGYLRDGMPFAVAHTLALAGLLAHGLLWGERLP